MHLSSFCNRAGQGDWFVMAEHNEIYRSRCRDYERLVAREDFRGEIGQTLQEICSWDGKVVVDLGAGTGRLSELVLPQAAFVCAFDRSPAMLAVAREKFVNGDYDNWGLAAADHCHVPLSEKTADRIISGWSLAYLALEGGPQWRDKAAAAFERFFHILRTGGKFIILETMGTGFSEPNPPDFLLAYFSFLDELGFQSKWIRTDYQFKSMAEALELSSFFFGEELAEKVENNGWLILPECTGVWWR